MPAAPWIKPPADLVARFAAALPEHPEIIRRPMFGCPCAFLKGNMFCGLFQDRAFVRLGPTTAAELVNSGQNEAFTPMPGRRMQEYILVPAPASLTPETLAPWLERALCYALTLPGKEEKVEKAGKADKGSGGKQRG